MHEDDIEQLVSEAWNRTLERTYIARLQYSDHGFGCDCENCVARREGYVYWDGAGNCAFSWIAEPHPWQQETLRNAVAGPLELDIPYV